VPISIKVVINGEASGDTGLEAAATHLSKALSHHDAASISAANTEIRNSCTRFGVWRTYRG